MWNDYIGYVYFYDLLLLVTLNTVMILFKLHGSATIGTVLIARDKYRIQAVTDGVMDVPLHRLKLSN